MRNPFSKKNIVSFLLFLFVTASLNTFGQSLRKNVNNIRQEVETTNKKLDANNQELVNLRKAVEASGQGQAGDPVLDTLNKIDYKDFYFGNITKEETLERKDNWVKVRLTEQIAMPNGHVVVRLKTAWYNYATPDIVYLVESTTDTQNKSTALTGEADKTLTGKTTDPIAKTEPSLKVSGKDALLAPTIGTSKPDNLDDKSLDMLLSQKAMNFDGIKFVNKRFDYVNFANGSYRGTWFENCNFTKVRGKRDKFSPETDFEEVTIKGGTHTNWDFAYWKFVECHFNGLSLNDPKFTNCIFSFETTIAQIMQTKFFRGVFNNTADGYMSNVTFNTVTFEGTRFQDVKQYGTHYISTTFTGASFYQGLWHGVAFISPIGASKIEACTFVKVSFVGGDYRNVKIEHPLKTQLLGVDMVDVDFMGTTIDVSLRENSKLYGNRLNLQGVNFKTSVMQDVQFGDAKQPTRSNLKNADFSQCMFNGNVKFIKCDVTGAKWPSDMTGITFTDCVGNP